MNRLNLLPLAAAPLLMLVTAVPAAAQLAGPTDNPNERINQLIIYGDDPCPKSSAGEIIVCARKPEGERFRIPEDLRNEPTPSTEAWTNKVQSYETVGNFGNNSCSPSGYGGWTGCTQALIDAAYQEDKTGKAVQFSELIAKARADRAGKIDEQAAQEQARVEQAEKDYDARQKANAGSAGDDTDTSGN